MGRYNFAVDLAEAKKTEDDVAEILANYCDAELLEKGANKDWDLKMKLPDGTVFTVEVKDDSLVKRTGNVGLEFECRGKASGIDVSKAHFYVYKLHEKDRVSFWLTQTKTLKEMVDTKLWHRVGVGGDVGSNTKMYLFKLPLWKEKSMLLEERVLTPRPMEAGPEKVLAEIRKTVKEDK